MSENEAEVSSSNIRDEDISSEGVIVAPSQEEDEKHFLVDRAKTGRAKCKKCKQQIDSKSVRLAKIMSNPFGTGKMNAWHHVPCLFEAFKRQRPTTAKIENVEDIGGWNNLDAAGQDEILTHMSDEARDHWNSIKGNVVIQPNASDDSVGSPGRKKKRLHSPKRTAAKHDDNTFRRFRKICANVANESSYLKKTEIFRNFFKNGSDGGGFKGDLYLWCKLLLPGAVKRVYNLQSKQLVKVFSRLFQTDHDDMLEHLEKGDVADTIAVFFEKSKKCKPAKSSTLTLTDVDEYLEQLTQLTREDDQLNHFSRVCKLCTTNDLKMLIRLIKHDLRINAGPKHVLEALDPDAYQAFQASRNLREVVKQLKSQKRRGSRSSSRSPAKKIKISIKLLTPVLPMLAEACKSIEYALKKCPNGMYAEIKYDGERVQLHKSGKDFKFFSRSLKPVLPHKVQLFEEYITKAFPGGKDLILDCEVLMVDKKTGNPLPFGTLGIHKKSEFRDAVPCLFVFDCLYFNGESLMDWALKKRKKVLDSNMKEIKNHIMFSEMEEIHTAKQLETMLTRVLRLGLEGLVLKDIMGTYEPGKRHWLKMKKDYLHEGSLADSVDLVVLGAWYGTGNKGGMMSVFLMGCYDPENKYWVTVTKVHGHDDKTLENLQDELKMVKISKDPSKVPSWLYCKKPMIPDFVASNPNKMPVWEISGAEFTKNTVHTANGISIRFPRVNRVRTDKTAKTATTLPELMGIYEQSKQYSDFSLSGKKSKKTLFSSGKVGDEEEVKVKVEEEEEEEVKVKVEEEEIKVKVEKEELQEKVKRERVVESDDETACGDDDTTALRSDDRFAPKYPFPDIFAGIKIYFPEEQKCQTLYRYYVAYGGDVLDSENCSEATHYIPSFMSQNKKFGTAIDEEWIWNNVQRQQLRH